MAGGKKKKAKHDGAKKGRGRKGNTVAALATTAQPEVLVAIHPRADAQRLPLTEMVPVRFDSEMLAAVRARAAADHRSVSAWIRRAVDLELHRDG